LSFAVVFNPYKSIKKHFESKGAVLDNAAYNTLIQRLSEIGATDLDEIPTTKDLKPAGEPTAARLPPKVQLLSASAGSSAIRGVKHKFRHITKNALPSGSRSITGQTSVKGGK